MALILILSLTHTHTTPSLPVFSSEKQTAWLLGSLALNWKMQPCLVGRQNHSTPTARTACDIPPCRRGHKGRSNIREPLPHQRTFLYSFFQILVYGRTSSWPAIPTLDLIFFSFYFISDPISWIIRNHCVPGDEKQNRNQREM